MSGLCGWTGYAQSAPGDGVASAMSQALIRYDQSDWKKTRWNGGALAATALHGKVALFERDQLRAAVSGRLWVDGKAVDDPAAVLAEGFVKDGTKVLDRLTGNFALAVVSGGEVLLATDRLGRRPLVYCHRGDTLVFASSGAALQAHPGARSAIDEQSIYEYFFFHQVPAPRTVRKDHRRLLPGEFLHFKDGRVRTETWTRPRFAPEVRDLEEWEREFGNELRESVRECAGSGKVGCFLSGGTDSSTIAGVLAELSTEKVPTYSIGFKADGYDEMEYARCAAEHFGTDHRTYYVTPDDVLSAVQDISAVHADPFANESAVPTYYCGKIAAADGIETMLAGDGGDELFGGNERYVSLGTIDKWQSVPKPLRGLVRAGANYFPFGSKINLIRKARSYIDRASQPMPDRIYAYALLNTLGADTIFEPSFLSSVDRDGPLNMARAVYHGADASDELNRQLALDCKITLADNDLVKVNRSCELAGVNVTYPLMTDRLTEFAGRLPIDYKVRGQTLRWFFKHALRDFLPQKVLTKSKHGFGLPFGVWLRTYEPLQEFSRDRLARLKKRGIVKPAFIDEIQRMHQTGHAGYYGVMVWTLIMLEQWFSIHEDPAVVAV